MPKVDHIIRLIESASATELALVAFLAILLGYLAVLLMRAATIPTWAKLIVFIIVAALVFTGMLLVLGRNGDSPPQPELDTGQVYYAFYGIDEEGVPTEGGQLRIFNSLNPQPAFEQITEGVVLATESPKYLRRLPTRDSDTVGPISGQRCLSVVTGQRRPVAPEEGLKSGGYLPVRIVDCPSR